MRPAAGDAFPPLCRNVPRSPSPLYAWRLYPFQAAVRLRSKAASPSRRINVAREHGPFPYNGRTRRPFLLDATDPRPARPTERSLDVEHKQPDQEVPVVAYRRND